MFGSRNYLNKLEQGITTAIFNQVIDIGIDGTIIDTVTTANAIGNDGIGNIGCAVVKINTATIIVQSKIL